MHSSSEGMVSGAKRTDRLETISCGSYGRERVRKGRVMEEKESFIAYFVTLISGVRVEGWILDLTRLSR